jgi:hypothetical protein
MSRTIRNQSRAWALEKAEHFQDGKLQGWAPGTKKQLKAEKGKYRQRRKNGWKKDV